MNRADRRKQEKQQRHEQNMLDQFKVLSPRKAAMIEAEVETKKRLQQNGITVKDLEDNYAKGYREGIKQFGEEVAMRTERQVFPAIAIVLHEKYGFGADRCCAVLNAIDEYILNEFTTVEGIEQAITEIGIQFDWAEPFNRFSKIERGKKE